MKRKFFAVFAALIIAIPLFSFSAFAKTPRWSLITSATAVCVEEDDLYYASVTSGSDVTQLDLSVVLYEKGLFSNYQEVSSIHRSYLRSYATVSGSYAYSSLKNYKVVLTATAHTASGQTETITISEEY